MTDQWFFSLFEQEFGPLSFDELQACVVQGWLAAEDQVKFGRGGKWRKVGSIGRLMVSLPQSIEKTSCAYVRAVNPPCTFASVQEQEPKGWRQRTRTQVIDFAPVVMIDTQPKACTSDEPAPKTKAGIVGPNESNLAFQVTGAKSIGIANPVTATALLSSKREYGVASTLSRHEWSNSSFAKHCRQAKSLNPQRYREREISIFEKIGVPQWLKEPRLFGISCAVALMLLIFGWGVLPKSHADDIKRYQTLKSLLDEICDTEPGSSDDLSILKAQLEETAKRITLEVKNKASSNDPAKQNLLRAARDDAPRFIRAGLAIHSAAGKEFANRLVETAYALELEQRPPMTTCPTLVTSDDVDD